MSVVELKAGGGLPTVKYIVGDIQPATYKSKLILKNETRIDQGSNSEIVRVGSPQITVTPQLNGASLIWDIRVVKATSKADEKYSIEVHVFQDGTEIGAPVSTDGDFGDDNAISWKESIIFDVV